jgi:hypothetical protein
VLEPTKIGIEYVTRNEPGSDPAGDGLQFALTDQRADVVLGATELRGDLAHGQGRRPLHTRSIAADSSIEFWAAPNRP